VTKIGKDKPKFGGLQTARRNAEVAIENDKKAKRALMDKGRKIGTKLYRDDNGKARRK
jgi:hypothetical protein